MKFVVDAQLPISLSKLLAEDGHDAVHTLELPAANATPDSFIRDLAKREMRVVVTKDVDFLQSHLVNGEPQKLLMVKTGNIKNSQLLNLFEAHLSKIVDLLETRSMVELSEQEIIAHP